MAWNSLDDLDLDGKIVLTRVDINVPMEAGRITDATRIEKIRPTIDDLRARGARVVLLAHFGRPKGKPNPEMSLAPLVPALEAALARKVCFLPDATRAAIAAIDPDCIVLLENTRFDAGEEANDPALVAHYAALGDIYCNDAFSAAHRAHATTEGLARVLPACAGRLMEAELRALDAALGNPRHPVLAIVGGAKISTKLDLLHNLVAKVDHLVIGGGMANTFLAALGRDVAKSLCEHDLGDTARAIMARAEETGCEIILPVDVVVAEEFRANPPHRICTLDQIAPAEMILDAGPASRAEIDAAIGKARTVIWNGPLGAFELAPFDAGTVHAAQSVARATRAGALISVAGGGDTVAALNHAGVAEDLTYISTAGGAFLEWMEGKTLPGVAALTA